MLRKLRWMCVKSLFCIFIFFFVLLCLHSHNADQWGQGACPKQTADVASTCHALRLTRDAADDVVVVCHWGAPGHGHKLKATNRVRKQVANGGARTRGRPEGQVDLRPLHLWSGTTATEPWTQHLHSGKKQTIVFKHKRSDSLWN